MRRNASTTNIVAGAWGGANTSALFHFSSTCYYFGESLTDELGAAAPPIGLCVAVSHYIYIITRMGLDRLR